MFDLAYTLDLGTSVSITASIASSEGADMVAATATLLASASGAVSEGGDTQALTATLQGSAGVSVIEGGDSLALIAANLVSVSAAMVEPADSVACQGALLVAGSSAIVEPQDGQAAFAAGQVSAANAINEAADSAVLTGLVGTVIIASLVIAEAADLQAAFASTQVSAANAAVEAADSAALAGLIAAGSAPFISGGYLPTNRVKAAKVEKNQRAAIERAVQAAMNKVLGLPETNPGLTRDDLQAVEKVVIAAVDPSDCRNELKLYHTALSELRAKMDAIIQADLDDEEVFLMLVG